MRDRDEMRMYKRKAQELGLRFNGRSALQPRMVRVARLGDEVFTRVPTAALMAAKSADELLPALPTPEENVLELLYRADTKFQEVAGEDLTPDNQAYEIMRRLQDLADDMEEYFTHRKD